MSIGDALFGLGALYVLLMFVGAIPPPIWFVMVWYERQKEQREWERGRRGD
jgi:hypothetical protein